MNALKNNPSDPNTAKRDDLPKLGFIGLGTMGNPMAQNLLKAGYALTVFDLNERAMQLCLDLGASAATSGAEAVAESDIVLTSLPSSKIFVQVAETDLLPKARPGQIFIDMGTTEAKETRRLAAAFAAKGANLIDAPVSGGGVGSASGTLYIFIGGDETVVNQCRPILEILGQPDQVTYCGSSSAGQVTKGVNQLAMGLGAAAYMEAIAFGVRAGVDPAVLGQAVGGPDGWRKQVAQIAQRVAEDQAEGIYVKFPELPYFMNEAQEQDFSMPLTEALFQFCDANSRHWRDNMNRPTVSFWYQLMHATQTGPPESKDH